MKRLRDVLAGTNRPNTHRKSLELEQLEPRVLLNGAPQPSVTVDLQAWSDSGVSDTDNVTNITRPAYDVTVNGVGTIDIDWDGDGVADPEDVVADPVAAAGTYQYSPSSALSDGTYTVAVTFTDAALNTAVDSDPTVIDTAGPTVSTVTPSGPVGSPLAQIQVVFSDSNDLWTSTVTDSGNYELLASGGDGTFGEANDVDVSGQIDGISYVAGTKTATLSLSPALTDEAYRFTVLGTTSVLDAAGNALNNGIDDVSGFTVGFLEPSVTVDLRASSDTGVSDSDNVTSMSTPTYHVTVNGPGTIDIDWDGDGVADPGDVVGDPVGAAGSYQYTAPVLADGVYDVAVTFTNTASSVDTDDDPTMIDTQAPDVPDAPDLQAASDTGLVDDDNLTCERTPTLDLTGFNEYYRLERDGGQISGDYGTSPTFTDSLAADDTYAYVVYAVDAAGNVSEASDELEVTLDTQAPAAPDVPDLQGADDSGMSDEDNVTSVTTVHLDLSGFGEYYRLQRDGVQISGDYATATPVTDGPLADATYAYTLYAADTAGNVSEGSSLNVEIDTTPPGAPNPPDLQAASDTGIPNNNITADRTPTFDVVVPEGHYFRLYCDGEPWSGGEIVGDDGQIYKDGSVEELGTHLYTATVVDAAGNESPVSGPLEVFISPFYPVAWREVDGVFVVIYDVDRTTGPINPVVAWSRAEYARGVTHILVNPGRIGDRIIRSITLYGNGSETANLGIVVEGNVGLVSLVDRRTVAQPLAFLVSEGYVHSLWLKGGITGYDLNEFTTEGGWTLDQEGDADLDGDGETDDLTGVYTEGYLRSLVAQGDVPGDIVAGGDLNSLTVIGGDLTGDVILAGSRIGKIIVRAQRQGTSGWVGGDIMGDIRAHDDIGTVMAIGGDITGTIQSTSGTISRIVAWALYDRDDVIWVGGSIAGNVTASGSIGTLAAMGGDISGTIQSTSGTIFRILARALYDRDDVTWVGGSITGTSITAAGNIWSIYAVGGDISSDIEATAGSIGRVIARGLWNGGTWTGGSITPAATVKAGSSINAIQAVNGSIIGDGVETVTITSGNLGLLQAIGGRIEDAVVDVDGASAGRGHIGTVQATGAGGIVDCIVEAEGRIGSFWSAGSISGGLAARDGLGSVYAKGDLSALVHVIGNMGKVSVRGDVLSRTIEVRDGNFGSLSAGGGVYGTDITVGGRFSGLYVKGDLCNSTIHAETLRRVVVAGRIWQDSGGEIHAYAGRFLVKDSNDYAIVDEYQDYWFDHHSPNTVRAWVGPII